MGLDLTGLEDRGVRRPVSRVTLLLDDETAVTAGDDSGAELRADCPDGTPAMAEAILSRLRGYVYHAAAAERAALDPAAELGDCAELGGLYGLVAEIRDHGDGYPDIAAPGEGEDDDEYPGAGPVSRAFDRKIGETRAAIEKSAAEIRLTVENELDGLSSALTVGLSSITGRVADAEAGLSQTLRLAADGFTVTNAAGDVLTIDGGQIDASGIRTELLDASRIRAADLRLTGQVAWSDLASDAQGMVNGAATSAAQAWNLASSAASQAQGTAGTVAGWTYSGTTYIDGRMLMTGTVRAGTLEGGEVYLLDSAGSRAGSFTLDGASSYPGSKVVMRSGAIELHAEYGALYLHGTYGAAFGVSDYLRCEGSIAPTQGGVHACGMSGRTWTDIWADNSVIQRSDLSGKEAVEYGLARYDAFYDRLSPMSFRFRDGASGRRHVGLGAQDVAAALEAAGIPDRDFAGFVRDTGADGAPVLALRYGEFIPLNIWQIQRLRRRVAALEAAMGIKGAEDGTDGTETGA